MLSGNLDGAEGLLPKEQAVEQAYESLNKYRIDHRKIDFIKDERRRAGGYGIVRRAKLYQSAYLPSCVSTYFNGPPQLVAVKQIRMSAADDIFDTKRAFTREMVVWSSLQGHEGVAKFLGFYADFEHAEAWLLSPWEPHGNIMGFISRRKLEVPEKLSLVYDTIDALTFLHQLTPSVCHGDVKSSNVLVNRNCRAVLCDFGLARLFEDSGFNRLETSTGFKGSIRWCSPELLDGAPRSPGSDIYAWAWLVWEMMTGEMPYQEITVDYVIIRKIFESPHPQVDGASRLSGCLQLWELMNRCWSVEPEQRPMGSMCLTTVSNLPRCIPTPALLDQTSYSPELLENLGDLEIWKENYDASAKYMEKALAIYEQRQDTKGIASVLRKQAGVAYRLDEYGRAKALASAALEKLRTLDDDLSTADTLVWLASSLDMEFKLDKAITYFEEALEIFRIHGRDVGVVRCLERLGEMFRRKGDFDKASGYLEDALVIASQVGDKVGEARATKCLGYLVWDQGDLEKAFATLQSASEMSRQLGLEYFVCEILQNLGTIRLVQENYQEAERLLRDSIPLAQKTHQVVTLAMSLSDLGCTRWKRGDIAEAEVLLEKARSTFQKTTFRGKARIGNLADLASLKAAQGDQVAALSLYDQAIAESRSLQLKPELSLYLEKKGLLLEEGRRYDEAALCFEASLVLDQELDSTEDVRNDIKLLACLPKTAIHDLCNRIASNVY